MAHVRLGKESTRDKWYQSQVGRIAVRLCSCSNVCVIMASKDKESAVLLGEESQITRKTSKKDLEARVAKLEISLGDALDDITKLEERVGALEDKEDEVAQSLVNQMAEVLRSEMGAIRDSLGGELQAVKELDESLKGDITLCKAAVAGGAIVREGPKMKIPDA